ncbi:MAG: hypothetical protein U1E67_09390 [Hyphomicrobiales bacterium]
MARAEVRLDQATQDYLEGSWLIGEKPVRGPCTLQAYSNSQLEFEFRNSGGRLTVYQPFDLFTPVRISAAERESDVLSITLDGRKNLKMKIPVRLLPPDRLEILSNPNFTPGFAYRCDKPNRTVTDGVSAAMLQILTSPASGGTLFVEAKRGQTAGEVCNPSEEQRSLELRWLQFEALGPVHFYVFGQGFEGKFDLEPIGSLHAVDDRTLKIEVLERLEGAGRAWDAGSHARPYTLTAIWDGAKLRIPELDTSFIRCGSDGDEGYEPAPLPLKR